MADLNTDQNLPFTLAITNAHGQPAPVDGVPVYASSDETVLTVDHAVDGMSGVVNSVAPGTARITVTADADTGAGTVTITGVSEDVHVTAGPSFAASSFKFTFGAPVDKASGAPAGP
jgi:hypothetical protein